MLKIISYNLNGIRAAMNKDLVGWLKSVNADIVCFQEIKATPDQFDVSEFENLGYKCYWYPAEKKGYSGVAILTKLTPDNIKCGMEVRKYDIEGRMLRADFKDFSVISVYHPSGTMGDERQAFKMQWLSDFQNYINELKKTREKLIICGDFNICHKPIDIHDPIRNATVSGFLPEEREWIGGFIESGFIDSFRYFNQQPFQYTWWSYRHNARSKNLGWRLDYQMVSFTLEKNLKRAIILPEAVHSDHCPVMIEAEI
ncbi:MAG: exodeoxyribonuclease III [Bacteroidales bacterium]|nr:exodeoxyribonuclease III [Bacteroidales bacterium]